MAVTLVSIVIPAYQAAATLPATLDSVLRQTHRDIEALVVDDGSTDATACVAAEYARRDRRVRVFRQTNAGVAAARNRAIAEARGEWVATIDADDIWSPHKIELQLAAVRRAPDAPAMVYSWSRRIDEQGNVLSDMGAPRHYGRVFDQLLASNFIRNASSAMIRRDAIRAQGGFDERLQAAGAQGAEDIKLYLAVAQRHNVAVAPHYLTGYRVVSGSMSRAVRRMRRSIDLVLSHVAADAPALAPGLMRLARMNYDLYAAALSRAGGDWASFVKFTLRALVSRPIDATVLLVCNAVWLAADRLGTGSPPRPFDVLHPDEEIGMPLLRTFEAYQARTALRAGQRPKATAASGRHNLPEPVPSFAS